VRNCRLELNNDGSNVVRFADPGIEDLVLKNVHVTGDAGDGTAVELGNCDIDANNLCLTQTGDNRDGISASSVTGTVAQSKIDVTGKRIVEDDDSDLTVRNLQESGTCPPAQGDLLLAVNGEASHGTAPLGWDICWFTTCRHDGPIAGPHRRYSYPSKGLGVIL